MAQIKIPPHLTPCGDAPDERVYLVKRQFLFYGIKLDSIGQYTNRDRQMWKTDK